MSKRTGVARKAKPRSSDASLADLLTFLTDPSAAPPGGGKR